MLVVWSSVNKFSVNKKNFYFYRAKQQKIYFLIFNP